MKYLDFAVLGQGLVFAAAIERVEDNGHRVVAIDTSRTHRSSLSETLSSVDFDVLLSVGNPWVLNGPALSRARLVSVNYHNSLLPAYAGLRAANWAILNGEVEHGITWHAMDAGIDTGRLLVQRRFSLAPDETAASLSLRCTNAAVEGLGELLARLSRGDLSGIVQEPQRRSYYGRRDTVPNGGIIDWNKPGEEILRLVRACSGGDASFGQAIMRVSTGEHRVVASAERTTCVAQPGMVLDDDRAALLVECADGAIRVRFADLVCSTDASGLVQSKAQFSDLRDRSAEASALCDTVPALIAKAAQQTPAAPAVVFGAAMLSYAELAARSAAVAHQLVVAGVECEAGVGILLPTGADFVVAALGAMRAGAAYVPLNIESPVKRRAVEIGEAGITHVITDRRGALLLDTGDPSVIDIATVQAMACDAALPDIAADSCAYRIFTSGSTGTPKAVEITHSALANLVSHCITALPLGPGDRMTMLAAPTFDAAVADIWPTLVAGGTILTPPSRILLDARGLVDWLVDVRATCAFVPTIVAERLIAIEWPVATSLHTLLTGGDTLHVRPRPHLPFRVVNSYGPTENCVASLWSTVAPGTGQPTIGKPIGGVSAEIVHRDGRSAKPGETGEIVLGGAQIARGYRCRPTLTSERFREDPTCQDRRRYYTGDLGRVNEDGEVEYCGRIDRQVQILGIRIEPDEVEAVLKAHDQVIDAVCIAERKKDIVTGLIAHVTTADAAQATAVKEVLAAHLASHLPPAARPKMVMVHKHLPLTTAGKIDRRALEADADVITPTSRRDVLEDLWAQAVPQSCADFGLSFWDAGGDSLAAIDLLLAVHDATGVHVAIGTFLADPTLAGLRHALGNGRASLVVRLREGAGPPLICWYGYTGDLEAYQQMMPALEGREVLGILSAGLADASGAPRSIEEAAAAGLESLRHYGVQPPFNMIGYSWGGLVAFEAARQQTLAGTPPSFVGLLGSIPPGATVTRAQQTRLLVQRIPKIAARLLGGHQSLPASSRRILGTLGRMVPTRPKAMSKVPARTGLSQANLDLAHAYRPPAGSVGNVWLFRESAGRHFVGLSGRVRHELDDLGWSAWTGVPVTVEWVDADHLNLMRSPAIKHVAAVVLSAMSPPELEASSQTYTSEINAAGGKMVAKAA